METKEENRRKVRSSAEQAAGIGGFPPRKTRHATRERNRMATFLGSGILIFAVVFVGLICVELYQASSGPAPSIESSKHQQGAGTAVKPTGQAAVPDTSVEQTGSPEQQTASVSAAPVESGKPAGSDAAIISSPGPAEAKAPNDAVSTAASKPKAIRHVVRKGDTLFKLSRQYYGNNFGVERIVRYNGLDPLQPLPIGKAVFIPLSNAD
ncbi:LysM peptidoglycan-binding domain-containing protein [Brevibacillus fulvus]|uniref:LysM repeat protein n=1 Tax=Brevibacillus fulvus TaxID=1125967 RepID=A0A938XXB1_9BACL|nr:LysM domain-containing protein [Brevibacillus fulvus]MBM7588674.1 LysM repeat protein [Brevibacillus fulvus]